MSLKAFDVLFLVVLLIGGINWGLVGFFGFNLIDAIFGTGAFSRIIYAIVGLSALYAVFQWRAMQCRICRPA